jgi:Potassium-transporting ATPase A subunit
MEGKEVRFGIGSSALAAVVTSNGATGSYNSMHGSFQPLGVMVPLVNMLLGEIVSRRSWKRPLQHDLYRVDSAFPRWTHDRPHAGTSWETNRTARDENYRYLYVGRAGHGLGVDSTRCCHKTRACWIDDKYWPPWLHGNSFCLCERFCQQRSEHGGPIRPCGVSSVVGWPLRGNVAAISQGRHNAFRRICLRRVAYWNSVVTWCPKLSASPRLGADRRALLHPFLTYG